MENDDNIFSGVKKLFLKLIPPPNWRLPVIILLGIFTGLGLSSFYISNAASYISDDPNVCINCHIMIPQFSTWEHSSHRQWASCNDCHVPHDNFVRKYMFKARDGLRHATMFTFRLEPQVIEIKEAGKFVVQGNCLRCHINQVNPVSVANVDGDNYKEGAGMLCWGCHIEVPHGVVHSEASTTTPLVPPDKPLLPWGFLGHDKNSGK